MNLNKILHELQMHKELAKNRDDVLTKCIQQRLTNSLSVYYNELDKTISYLNTKNNIKLLKKLNNTNN